VINGKLGVSQVIEEALFNGKLLTE
jgi:hypothetical protein